MARKTADQTNQPELQSARATNEAVRADDAQVNQAATPSQGTGGPVQVGDNGVDESSDASQGGKTEPTTAPAGEVKKTAAQKREEADSAKRDEIADEADSLLERAAELNVSVVTGDQIRSMPLAQARAAMITFKRDIRVAEEKANRLPCLCGCGGIPISKNAKYLPGHDAIHHAAQKRAKGELKGEAERVERKVVNVEKALSNVESLSQEQYERLVEALSALESKVRTAPTEVDEEESEQDQTEQQPTA
jgi:hypothetical protein